MLTTLFFALVAADPALAERIIREIGKGEAEKVFARFTPEMAAALPKEKNAAFLAAMTKDLGPLKSVDALGNQQGTFLYRLRFERGSPQMAALTLDAQDKIAGFYINPDTDRPPSEHDAYVPKVKLSLPFSGEWTARNAARSGSNPHYVNRNQRFAVDWLVMKDGKTFKTDGAKNEDYLCYGADMLAPADGVVVSIVDGVPENVPQKELDAYHVTGNEIVLDLGQGEYAHFAHAIPRSFRVTVGTKVKRGQVLARVGNSGNSSEPHLHFQLMDDPRLFRARALPAKFVDVFVDGKKEALAWPGEGARVRAK